ncbi:MAG: hypothetical protein ACK53V_08205, partial [Planctomycetota bacterium]
PGLIPTIWIIRRRLGYPKNFADVGLGDAKKPAFLPVQLAVLAQLSSFLDRAGERDAEPAQGRRGREFAS